MRTAGRAAAVAALVVGLAACSPATKKATPPGATVGTAPPETTTTALYAVPPVIDAAYLTKVMAGLDAITGDITRIVIRTRNIPPEAIDRLKSMYTLPNVNRESDLYARDLSEGLKGYRENPGNERTTVRELISVSPKCVFFRVERDYSAVGINGATARTEWIALETLDRTRDPGGYNPTGWSYRYEGTTPQKTAPEQDPCTA